MSTLIVPLIDLETAKKRAQDCLLKTRAEIDLNVFPGWRVIISEVDRQDTQPNTIHFFMDTISKQITSYKVNV